MTVTWKSFFCTVNIPASQGLILQCDMFFTTKMGKYLQNTDMVVKFSYASWNGAGKTEPALLAEAHNYRVRYHDANLEEIIGMREIVEGRGSFAFWETNWTITAKQKNRKSRNHPYISNPSM